MSTISGNITVDAATRGFFASTTSGEINVRRAARRIEIKSASGDITWGSKLRSDRRDRVLDRPVRSS